MAIVSKFERGGISVNLNTSPGNGFQLESWNPKVANPLYMDDPRPVIEVLKVRNKNSSHNNLADDIQDLHDMQIWAENYIKDPTEQTPVWLHAKMDNESGERRALVRKIDVFYDSSWYGEEATAVDVPMTIVVTREPYWERTAARTLPDKASIAAAASITYDYTAAGDGGTPTAHDIVGDVGARLRMQIRSGTASTALGYFAMGLRTKGTLGNFVNVWECEDGVNGAISSDDTTSETTLASPGGGSGAFVDSDPTVNDTWYKALTIRLSDVTANFTDNYGLFMYMLRAKPQGTGRVFDVQFKHGYQNMVDAQFIDGPILTLDTGLNVWHWLNMGIAKIPLRNSKIDVSNEDEGNLAIQVWTRRTTGTLGIYFDCICPIPVDEGYLVADIAEGAGTFDGAGDYLELDELPTGEMTAMIYDNNNAQEILEPDDKNFRLPRGDGRLIVVYGRDKTATVLTDTIEINPDEDGQYFERWLSLRGNE